MDEYAWTQNVWMNMHGCIASFQVSANHSGICGTVTCTSYFEICECSAREVQEMKKLLTRTWLLIIMLEFNKFDILSLLLASLVLCVMQCVTGFDTLTLYMRPSSPLNGWSHIKTLNRAGSVVRFRAGFASNPPTDSNKALNGSAYKGINHTFSTVLIQQHRFSIFGGCLRAQLLLAFGICGSSHGFRWRLTPPQSPGKTHSRLLAKKKFKALRERFKHHWSRAMKASRCVAYLPLPAPDMQILAEWLNLEQEKKNFKDKYAKLTRKFQPVQLINLPDGKKGFASLAPRNPCNSLLRQAWSQELLGSYSFAATGQLMLQLLEFESRRSFPYGMFSCSLPGRMSPLDSDR